MNTLKLVINYWMVVDMLCSMSLQCVLNRDVNVCM